MDIVANREAAVTMPGPDETRDIFAARRVAEAGIVRAVLQRITHGEAERPRHRLRAEHDALNAREHEHMVEWLAAPMRCASCAVLGHRRGRAFTRSCVLYTTIRICPNARSA